MTERSVQAVTEICFVLSPGQNHFFFELADALCLELRAAGLSARVSTDGFPARSEDRVYALLPPHEYFVLEGNRRPPAREALRRTILIGAEQPETIHFHQNLALAGRAGALFDINSRAVRAYRRRGVRARQLRLGYTPSWDHFDPGAARMTDVLFLAAYTHRRGRVLGHSAEVLAGLRSRLVISDNARPNTPASTGFLTGDDKWRALADARLLLNVHQGPEPYFEWHRILQAIHCGAAVVTETSTDHRPLEQGAHFEMAAADDLPATLTALAENEERRREQAIAAYQLIRAELPLSRSALELADAAEELRAGRRDVGRLAAIAARVASVRVRAAEWRLERRDEDRPARHGQAVSAGARGPSDALERIEAGPDRVLLLGPDQELLPGGLERLTGALDAAPEATFAFGLVAVGGRDGIANPFAWEPDHEVIPPLLVARGAVEDVIAGRGRGVNARQLVARSLPVSGSQAAAFRPR